VPFDIEIQDIPARPDRDEPAHQHYDIRYVFVAADEALTAQAAEVHAAEWLPLAGSDPRLERHAAMIDKMRRLSFIR